MPLAVGTGTAPTPSPPPPVVVTSPPPAAVGAPRATWTDPTGVTWELTSPLLDTGLFLADGPAGWGAAPITHTADARPRGGSGIRHMRPEPRTITLPLHVYGVTHDDFTTRLRGITAAFTATRRLGPGTLRVWRPDGSAREILGYYADGLGGDAGAQQGWLYANPVVQILCEDPFWRATTAITETRSHTGATTPYLSPYRTVSSGRTLGETTVHNQGDTEAWPDWVITGPASEITATNDTTGESFTLTFTLLATETVTIATDPNNGINPPSVLGPAGQNLVGSLDWPDAVLWGLQPGPNDVEFSVTGSGAGTSVALSYVPRYETA